MLFILGEVALSLQICYKDVVSWSFGILAYFVFNQFQNCLLYKTCCAYKIYFLHLNARFIHYE